MAIQTRRQSLTQARLLFNQQGAVPGGMVAEPILRSWRRCADLVSTCAACAPPSR